jgi:hypothetical protein
MASAKRGNAVKKEGGGQTRGGACPMADLNA